MLDINSGSDKVSAYDKNLNYINSFTLPSTRECPTGYIAVDKNDNIYFTASASSGSDSLYYLYVLNPNLTARTSKQFAIRTGNYGTYTAQPIVDNAGNAFIDVGWNLYKVDINGNVLWTANYEAEPLAYDEAEGVIYAAENFSTYERLYKFDASTGARLDYVDISCSSGRLEAVSLTDTHLVVTSSQHIGAYVYKKLNLEPETALFPELAVRYDGFLSTKGIPGKVVISADGQVVVFTGSSDQSGVFRPGLAKIALNSYNSSGYAVYDAVFGSDNTLYVICEYVTFDAYNHVKSRSGNIGVLAYGTGGTEQNADNTLRKLRDYIPSNSSIDYTVSITDSPYQDNTDANFTTTANLLKANNDRFLMIGNSSSKPDGQKILNKGVAGSLFDINSNMLTPLTGIGNYIINDIGSPNQRVYEYCYKKGEIVNYDVFYSDYELDPSKASQWRYYHTAYTDGTIANNGAWLSAPITQFTKNGTYRVQHRQIDNTGVMAYDIYSNIIELTIHVEDGTVVPPTPPPGYIPEGNIDLEGYTKQNRKLTLKLDYSTNNALPLNASSISWTLTPVSGIAAADIKRSSLTAQNIDTLYKKAGRVRATCTFRDTNGNQGSTTTEFDISADLAPAGTLQITPVVYRNGSGVATMNVKVNVASSDDFIDSIKYYITYDADNNGSYANDTRTYLPQFENLREFNIDVNTGVGSYLIQLEATEGFKEPTIAAYISGTDYLKLTVQGMSNVDNIAPSYDVRPEKNIYLIGEEIRFKSYDGSFLNGDSSKGFFDTERDSMTGFKVKYTQNKAIMPLPDGTSAYHNVLRTAFINSLDRAGEYTIDINAYDDPKAGDARFASYNRPSNTSTSKIIVHRRPIAALSFTPVHDTAPVFDFGNNMYLDGTHLRIADASKDPDGFNVTWSISYKADSGEYIPLDSGDTISLYYGSVFTVKVTAEDNWGADDTAIYTITVVNGLDMVPEVIPQTVPASEDIILRLTTNQYATNARAVIFGQSMVLSLKSRSGTEMVWETGYTIPENRADALYTVQFYAVSEGVAEIQEDDEFQVLTPINLVPNMPGEVVTDTGIAINASTSKYANTTTVQLFTGTPYQTAALILNGNISGSIKNWSLDYTVPAGIPVGNYTARFTSTTPNGNIQTCNVIFRVESLRINEVTIRGYWNHWRGQVDMFGKQMSIEPHRFLSLEKVRIDIHTTGYADRIDIRFSPELEAMRFTDMNGNRYDYFDDYGLLYVYFPATFTLDAGQQENHLLWEYTLPLAPSTVSWDDIRKRPQYKMTVTAWKGEYSVTYTVDDIDITGNIYDLTYIQPVD